MRMGTHQNKVSDQILSNLQSKLPLRDTRGRARNGILGVEVEECGGAHHVQFSLWHVTPILRQENFI